MHSQTASATSGWAIAGLVIAILAVIVLVLIVLFNRPPPPPPKTAAKAQIKGKSAAQEHAAGQGPLESGATLLESPEGVVGRPYVNNSQGENLVTTGADMPDSVVAPKGRPLRDLAPESSSSSSSEDTLE